MKITVTQEDIREGARANCLKCPIALALERALKPLLELDIWYRVQVNEDNVEITNTGAESGRFAALLPEEAEEFIRRFDNRQPVEPFEFELNLGWLESEIKELNNGNSI